MKTTRPIEGKQIVGPIESGRCTAHSSRTGERCRRRAISGSNVCPMHGAAAPQVRAKAAERVKEQKARVLLARLGVPVPTDPITALQACLDEAAGNLDALRAVVCERTETADPDPSDPVIRLYADERDRKSTRLNSSHIQKSRMPSSA